MYHYAVDMKKALLDIGETLLYRRNSGGAVRRYCRVTPCSAAFRGDVCGNSPLFILGSGPSINTLSDAQWEHVARHRSMGLNFWPVHEFVPTDYLFEHPRPPDRAEALRDLLALRAYDYRDTRIYSNVKTYLREPELTAIVPSSLRDNVVGVVPFYFQFRTEPMLSLSLTALYKGVGCFRLAGNWGGVHHCRGSLSLAISIALALGYERIVLLGIDLHCSEYFWESQSWTPTMPELLPESSQASKVHRTADRQAAKSLTIVEYVAVLRRVVLGPSALEVYVGTDGSCLENCLGAYHWPQE